MSLQNKILAGGIALQAVILIIIFWPSSSGPNVEQLLSGIEESQVVEMTITDLAGSSIRLRRGPSGCVLPQADDYPCLEDKLTSFTSGLVNIDTASLIAQTPASHRRLKVADDDFDRLIELQLADGSSRRIYLGTSIRPQSLHARVENRNEVYFATGITTSDAFVQPTGWVEPNFFNLPLGKMVAFTQENARGRIRLERDENGVWSLPEESPVRPLAQDKVETLVRKADSLRMFFPLGKEELASYGLQDPLAVVTIETLEDGNSREYVLYVGARDAEQETYVVNTSESPYYFLIHQFYVQDFVHRVTESVLVEPPPTPTPEPSESEAQPVGAPVTSP